MTSENEERIVAYVDGELAPLDALRFERAMEADPALAAAVASHRRLRGAIEGRFAGIAIEPVPDRLRRVVDRHEGRDRVIPFPARPRASLVRSGKGYAALAATLVAGLVAGQFLPRAMPGPFQESGGRIVADGGLAHALDGQLASTQPSGAAWRIGVSFRSRDGRYCRSFEGMSGAGLGCHGAAGWTLERFAGEATGPRTDYRQAGAPGAAVLAAAQEMMAGDPLDAVAERRARDAGWR